MLVWGKQTAVESFVISVLRLIHLSQQMVSLLVALTWNEGMCVLNHSLVLCAWRFANSNNVSDDYDWSFSVRKTEV